MALCISLFFLKTSPDTSNNNLLKLKEVNKLREKKTRIKQGEVKMMCHGPYKYELEG